MRVVCPQDAKKSTTCCSDVRLRVMFYKRSRLAGSAGRPPVGQWRGRAPAQAHLYGGLRAAPRDVAWGRGSAPGAPRKALRASLGRGRPSPAGHVETETSLRRGLLEPGITFGVTRTTREGGSRRAVGVMRKRLCKAAKQGKRLPVIRRHTKKKASSPHSTNIWPCSSFGAAGMGIAPSIMQGIRSRGECRVPQVW